MPLSRYQIRNEYSLADPELYKSADKDDPEALLEGVAMAGLVGVLRQLGDLAEFAAEVFHNLHEEVMATAARGHSLKARVQQLEVEFPLIEKTFLMQTNHSAFFYNAGIDWHPNMHIDQNYITRGDLPRFVRDSHEEARGPPRLFLLDKFDVAGAGACLKRFTDPSFYKVEAITNADVQRDKKSRKGKRRGSRWRNGETPEVLPTPHAKLHQLLLEERIENSASDPTRRVKLKRRLNGFPFDLKTGKSYMEKILRTPQPDYRELHEVYNSSPLKLPGSNFIPELDKDDFDSESLDVELTQRSPSMSPDLKDGIQNGSMREMEFESSNESDHSKPEFGRGQIGLKSPDLELTYRNPSLTPDMRNSVPNIFTDEEFEAFGIESKDFPKVKNSLEVGDVTSTPYEDAVEKHIMVDKESKSEGSTGYKSVDFASDVENYMDALATMELETETDSELRLKGNLHVLSNRKLLSGPDAATPLRESHFSDSQSIGSSTLSDDGNSSSKKYKSNSSYSGSPRILANKACLEDELSNVIDLSNETGETKNISRPLKWKGRTRNAGGSKITAIPPYSSVAVDQTFPNADVSPGLMVNRDANVSVGENGVSQTKLVGMLSAEGVPGAEASNANESELSMSVNVPSDSKSSVTLLHTEYDSISQVVPENQNHLPNNVEDSQLMESSSCKPSTSNDTCFTEGSKDQHTEQIVDKNMLYILQDVTPASCNLDGTPLNHEENLSSPKYQPLSESSNDDPRMSEHPSKPSAHEMSENRLHGDLSNDESGACEDLGVLYRDSVHPSSCTENTAEEGMSKPSLEDMPQGGDGEDDFEAYPIVNQSNSQITIMPPAAEHTVELIFPELGTDNRETDAETTDDNQVRTVSLPNSENFHTSGMIDILQPLDPVDKSMDNQIEERFPDTPRSDTQDTSDGPDHTTTILGGEIAVDVEDQALSGMPEGAGSKNIQAPLILVSVSQSDVETSDEGDEILHEIPSLGVRVEPDVAPAGEADQVRESLSVMPASETTDDLLLLNAATVETLSEQMEDLHEPARLVGQKLDRVASSTDLGERSTTGSESISVSINTSDADVVGCLTQSNQYEVDTEVPFSVTYSGSGTEEKGNIQKVDSQSIDYDHSESSVLNKLSDSYSELESSLPTDITTSLTTEQSGSNMNVVRAEKNTLDDRTMDALPIAMYYDAQEQKVDLPLHHLDEEETGVFRIPGECNMDSNLRDSSVLERSESTSKWVDSEKSVSTNCTKDTSLSTHSDEEEHKVKLAQQLNEGINQASTFPGESIVGLEPQLRQSSDLDHLLGQGKISGIASIPFSRDLPGQQSELELFPLEKPTIDDIGQHNKLLGSISPAFGLLSEAVNTDQMEMPPLPPLPPVQWRMGKTQQGSLAFPSISPGSNSNLLSHGELRSLDNSLPLPGNCADLAAVTESHSPNHDYLLPVNNSKFPSMSETQSSHQNLPMTAKLDEMPQHDDHTCTTLNASSSGSNGDVDAVSATCDVELVVDSSTLVQFNKAEETGQNNSFYQGSATSESHASTHDASALLTKVENERPHNMMLSLEGEVAWPTQEDGKPYGVRPMKLPRQRNPLIDAVIALDKSKLRKVAEQPRTQIQKADERDSVLENLQLRKVTGQLRTQIQKADERDSVLENLQLRKVTELPRSQIQEADERDSLLEQIRAKSFNLKPPVVSKPAVQGPTTNLKLAAILEKAKTIRQAFAGSDEDDDDDSWSDS